MWSPRITEKRKNVAARILLMLTACNFQKRRQTLGTWRKLMELVQEVVKPSGHYDSLFSSPENNLQHSGISRAPALACGPFEEETADLHEDEPPMNTKTDGPPSTTSGPGMLLQFCSLGVTLSWEEAPPGARASRPHKSSRSFGHLLHRNQPAAAPCLCFGRAHAVPAGRAVGCNIAGKLSGNRRESMRAGRPRSRGCRPVRRQPLRFRLSPPNQKLIIRLLVFIRVHSWFAVFLCGNLFFPPDLWRNPLEPSPTPWWPFVVLRGPSWITLLLPNRQ